jgi:ribosomal protein S12 methylthiotransferase
LLVSREKEFQEMVEFVERMKFERLGVFTYSHEESTHAFGMEYSLSQEVKQEPANHFMDVQEQISYDLNQEKIGKTFKVLIDKKEGGHFVGRTDFDSVEVDNEVLIDAAKYYCRVGDFVTARITDATEFDLFGEVVE